MPRDVQAVVLGNNGILEGSDTSTVYMDLSTNSPHHHPANPTTPWPKEGVTVLDAPVSGGVYGAAAGTLAVMVGGDKAVFDRMKPTLDAIGSHVVYCGPIGNGMVCKICNNLLSMGIGVLMTEALTLGVKAGVDLATLADVIANSSGGNRRLVEKFPRYLFQGNFEPGFATALAAKDVRPRHRPGPRIRHPHGTLQPGRPAPRRSHVPRLGTRRLRRRLQNPRRKSRRPATPAQRVSNRQ